MIGVIKIIGCLLGFAFLVTWMFNTQEYHYWIVGMFLVWGFIYSS